jgi:hypothetical protein
MNTSRPLGRKPSFEQSVVELNKARHSLGEPLSDSMKAIVGPEPTGDWLETLAVMHARGDSKTQDRIWWAVIEETEVWQKRDLGRVRDRRAREAIIVRSDHEGTAANFATVIRDYGAGSRHEVLEALQEVAREGRREGLAIPVLAAVAGEAGWPVSERQMKRWCEGQPRGLPAAAFADWLRTISDDAAEIALWTGLDLNEVRSLLAGRTARVSLSTVDRACVAMDYWVGLIYGDDDFQLAS